MAMKARIVMTATMTNGKLLPVSVEESLMTVVAGARVVVVVGVVVVVRRLVVGIGVVGFGSHLQAGAEIEKYVKPSKIG